MRSSSEEARDVLSSSGPLHCNRCFSTTSCKVEVKGFVRPLLGKAEPHLRQTGDRLAGAIGGEERGAFKDGLFVLVYRSRVNHHSIPGRQGRWLAVPERVETLSLPSIIGSEKYSRAPVIGSGTIALRPR